jgi:tape measure domain-containing protein
MASLRELLVTIETKLNEPAMKEAQRRIDNELSKAEKKFNRVYKQVLKEQAVALKEMQDKQRRAMQSMNDTANKLGGVLAGVFVGLAVAIPVATFAMLKLNSEITQTIAKIGILSGNTKNATKDFEALLNISSETGLAFDAVADVYGRLNMNAKELNVTQEQMMNVTRGVSQALILSGGTMASQQGALMQLGQAFGNPIIQAQEFNSLLDGAPLLAKEMAQSILGSKGTAGALRRLVLDQKLTNKMMFIAIEDALPRLNKQFKQMPLTLDMVANKFNLMGLRLGLAFKDKISAPQEFLKMLDSLIQRTTSYLIKNKELIGIAVSQFFNNLTVAINGAVTVFKILEPLMKLIINNLPLFTSGVVALTTAMVAFVAITKAYALYQAIANAVMLASPTTWLVLGISALIGILAVLVMNWKSVTSAIQTAYAWLSKMASLVASFSMDKIGQLITLVGGGVKPPAKVKPAMAQRQASGGNINNSRKSLSNSFYFSNTPSTAQAKSIGNNLVSSSNRAFYALN